MQIWNRYGYDLQENSKKKIRRKDRKKQTSIQEQLRLTDYEEN